MRMFAWSAESLEKKRFAAVLIRVSVSPTETIALARIRTLIGCGVPLRSRSAVWSVMSRSTFDRLARKRRPGREKRDLLRLAGPAIDDGAPLQPAHHANRSRVDVSKEGRDDEW